MTDTTNTRQRSLRKRVLWLRSLAVSVSYITMGLKAQTVLSFTAPSLHYTTLHTAPQAWIITNNMHRTSADSPTATQSARGVPLAAAKKRSNTATARTNRTAVLGKRSSDCESRMQTKMETCLCILRLVCFRRLPYTLLERRSNSTQQHRHYRNTKQQVKRRSRSKTIASPTQRHQTAVHKLR